MTLPTGFRSTRTTAAQRRQQREEYAQLKQADASPSMAAYRELNRRSDRRTRIRRKLAHIVKGGPGRSAYPFTGPLLKLLRPAEAEVLRGFVRDRLAKLSDAERVGLQRNLFFLIAPISDRDLRALIEFTGQVASPPKASPPVAS